MYVFRNPISLEHCCPNYEYVITSYPVNPLITSSTHADNQILCKSKAIVNWMNIDEATRFLNRLYNDTFCKKNYYHQFTNIDENEYCGRSWHSYRRVHMCDYFNQQPCMSSYFSHCSSAALILTFLQTLFAIIKG